MLLLCVSSFTMVAAFSQVMQYFSSMSGNETSIFASQLSFSGQFLKDMYATIIAAGGMDAYRTTVTLDYGFMTGYGLLSFSLAVLLARWFPGGSPWQRSYLLLAVIAPAGACMDAVENAFILATLLDPLAFDDWLAVAHSTFALVKWVILFASMGWTMVGVVHRVTAFRTRVQAT